MGRKIYDVSSVILIVLFVLYMVFLFIKGGEGILNVLLYCVVVFFLVYSFLIVVLGFKIADRKSHSFLILVGAVVVLGFVPLVIYFVYLRKRIGFEYAAKEQSRAY